jgi:glycosyltransferase involved in cell wall biosynthesis
MNKVDTFFSIIIPVYNREKTIERALKSCLIQTFQNFEIIVVDDCSTDNSLEIIESIKDDRIKVISNETNSERCISRNKGIEASQGKFICFLDSDDYFLKDHLETFHDQIIQSEIEDQFLFTNSYLETENNERIIKKVPFLNNQNVFSYLLMYTPNPARVCVSKNILSKLDFDPNLPGIEDLDLWLRIATKYLVKHIEKITNVYFSHSESYSQGDKKRYTKELHYFKIIKNKHELKDKLPRRSINRLISMCHFHLAVASIDAKRKLSFYKHAFVSFVLCPYGYNGKTNKILFVNMLYFIPVLGVFIRSVYRRIKS